MNQEYINNKNLNYLLLIGIILVGSNLRVPITSVGALITFIREDLAISNGMAGLITTLPLLMFALLSPFAPKIANRFGMELTIFFSIILLLVGMIVRSITGISFLFLGTIFVGLAISFGNVLIPGIIKLSFPHKIGIMTGMYAVFMNIFGALGSGLSVPIANLNNFGWQKALLFWAGLTIIALIVWMPQLGKRTDTNLQVGTKEKPKSNLSKSPIAWNVTLFMGAQSLVFYTLITWLPDILTSLGLSLNFSGWMVFLMQLALIPTTFIIPIIAERMNNQIGLAIFTASLFIIGFSGLLLGQPILIPLWAILLGIAGGSSFSLAMMFFTIRTQSGQEAAELSGMAQSFGYLLAALGPVLVGVLYDWSASWTAPLIFLIIISVGILFTGINSGKKRFI